MLSDTLLPLPSIGNLMPGMPHTLIFRASPSCSSMLPSLGGAALPSDVSPATLDRFFSVYLHVVLTPPLAPFSFISNSNIDCRVGFAVSAFSVNSRMAAILIAITAFSASEVSIISGGHRVTPHQKARELLSVGPGERLGWFGNGIRDPTSCEQLHPSWLHSASGEPPHAQNLLSGEPPHAQLLLVTKL